jgi:hypothetical protein
MGHDIVNVLEVIGIVIVLYCHKLIPLRYATLTDVLHDDEAGWRGSGWRRARRLQTGR